MGLMSTAMWHVNCSPLWYAVKSDVSEWHLNEKRERRRQAEKAPRLTSFMVDTAKCRHMGSRMAPGHGRLLYTATFFAFPRIYPGAKIRPFSPTAETPPLQKLVMGL